VIPYMGTERKFNGLVYRLHDPVGTTKGKAQRVAQSLRDKGYLARITAPLIAGDMVNVAPRKYWVYKRRK